MSDVVLVAPDGTVPSGLALLSHTIHPATSVATGLEAAAEADVIIVDGSADLAWARTIVTSLRTATIELPILLLAPPTGLSLLASSWGFSDFVSSDAEPTEVDVRIRLLMGGSQEQGILTVGPLRVDEAAYHATAAGAPVDLTYTEFELLRYLMQHPGRVLTREVLLSQVWGYDYYGGTRTVDVHVRRLRAKLGQYDHFIQTVRNVGYRLAVARERADG